MPFRGTLQPTASASSVGAGAGVEQFIDFPSAATCHLPLAPHAADRATLSQTRRGAQRVSRIAHTLSERNEEAAPNRCDI